MHDLLSPSSLFIGAEYVYALEGGGGGWTTGGGGAT